MTPSVKGLTETLTLRLRRSPGMRLTAFMTQRSHGQAGGHGRDARVDVTERVGGADDDLAAGEVEARRRRQRLDEAGERGQGARDDTVGDGVAPELGRVELGGGAQLGTELDARPA